LSAPGALLRLGRLTFNQRVVGSIPTALAGIANSIVCDHRIKSQPSRESPSESESTGVGISPQPTLVRQLLSDIRTIFETLSGQEGINKIILSLRDINR
jgi:hypothetical protein